MYETIMLIIVGHVTLPRFDPCRFCGWRRNMQGHLEWGCVLK